PILVGDNGVGKKSIVEGIVWRIVNKDVPENLLNKTIYMVDLASIVAGAKYKGELEERLKFLLDEVKSSSGQVILFFEDIHNMVGGGRDNSNSEAASIIKLAVARGEIYIIGTTTADDYQKSIESDKVLSNALQNVEIEEPSVEETFSILRGTQERFEDFHKVGIADDALKAAAELSARYISEKKLPEKAIDLIDEAASKLKLELNSIPDDIDLLQRKIEQLKVEKNIISKEKNSAKEQALIQQIDLASNELTIKKNQWDIEKKLHSDIINLKTKSIELRKKLDSNSNLKADEANKINEELQSVHQSEEQALASLNAIPEQDRFVSNEVTADEIAAAISRWTGIPVNKMLKNDKERLLTLEAEIGKRLIGQKEAVVAVCDAVRRSRAGLQDPNKPIGSFLFLGPTGVGKTELAKALAEVLFDDENAITRIDMSEYQEKHAVSRLVGAPPGYVGYDEGGQLTEAVRRKPYSIVLLDEIEKAHPDTFNILLQLLDDGRLTDNKGRTANFRNTIVIMTSNMGSEKILENFEDLDALGDKHKADIIETTKEEVLEILKENLKPEFLNRIDDKIVFTPLSKAEVKQIAKLMLKKVSKNLGNQEMKIEFTDNAMNLLVDMGYDPAFGARPLKRVIDKELVNHLAKAVLGGDFSSGDTIFIGTDKTGFTFNKTKPESEAVPSMVEEKKEQQKKENLTEVEKAAKDLQKTVDEINKDKKE
ncbi:MAG: ATP-dependent chaperone ClpB, partial [Bacteroidota bacterium]